MRIAFVTTNRAWGGSEFLWHKTACLAARLGHDVSAWSRMVLPDYALKELLEAGVLFCPLRPPGPVRRWWQRLRPAPEWQSWLTSACAEALATWNPDLVVISQGGNYDGWPLAEACQSIGKPYALIAEQAGERYWPTDAVAAQMRRTYAGARHGWFVSQSILSLSEWQCGMALSNASVVRNPFLVDITKAADTPWPHTMVEETWNLACVARLDVHDKGQDLLVHLLALPKWRARPIRMTLFGKGRNAQGLVAMAKLLGVTQLDFGGHVDDIQTLWANHHGIILPSRVEGLPLALVEAMLCNRMAIVTDVAGNSEVVTDGETGFVASAPTVRHLDEALERAWQARTEWQAMGMAAGKRIRELVPNDPVAVFLDEVLRVAKSHPQTHAP